MQDIRIASKISAPEKRKLKAKAVLSYYLGNHYFLDFTRLRRKLSQGFLPRAIFARHSIRKAVSTSLG